MTLDVGMHYARHMFALLCLLQMTYKRLKDAVQSLGNASQQGPAAGLIDVLFGTRTPRFVSQAPSWVPFNSGSVLLCAI